MKEVARRCGGKVAIVTGRPRKDCDKFLCNFGLDSLFKIRVCMEDAPAKPDPSPVLLACKGLGVNPANCLMIGDTPDDIRAGISAGSMAIGVLTPEEDAKIVLGISTTEQGMTKSIMSAGAIAVMRPGLGQLLDFVLPQASTLAHNDTLDQCIYIYSGWIYFTSFSISFLA